MSFLLHSGLQHDSPFEDASSLKLPVSTRLIRVLGSMRLSTLRKAFYLFFLKTPFQDIQGRGEAQAWGKACVMLVKSYDRPRD